MQKIGNLYLDFFFQEPKKALSYIYLWLIHVDIWQKSTQYCKAIILQLKINFSKKHFPVYTFGLKLRILTVGTTIRG